MPGKFRNDIPETLVAPYIEMHLSFRNYFLSDLIRNEKIGFAIWIVIPVVVGSSPIGHPKISR
jgi:hypothetical protein